MRTIKEKKWTEGQKDAISASGGTVLVSAAAGSGKTAVLVQRVIEKITDKHNPIDADKLLIVTFTNVAASEMKERISEKLSELVAKDPSNTGLMRQKILLTNANISTIHSFCSNLIRENFYKLSVSPDFKIADSNEMAILKSEATQNVIDSFYEDGDSTFFNLVESFSSDKNDFTFEKAINTLYDFLRSHPFPKSWLDEKKAMYLEKENISNTLWGQTLFSYAKSAVEHCIALTESSLELIRQDEAVFLSYNDAFMSDLHMLLSMKNFIDKMDWNGLHFKFDSLSFEKLKNLKSGINDEIKDKVTSNRTTVKAIIGKVERSFYSDEKEALKDIEKLKPLVEKFFDVVWKFWEELDNLKAQKNIIDFGDLEHLTLKLLVRKTDDGFEKTEDAIAISSKFDEVLVDEYQDTNEAQDIIFRAISKNEKNLFIVGDVKQSIYGFRQAMPEIFLKRKEEYSLYNSNASLFPAKIILDKNFRSRKGITSSVNFIFKQLMSKEIGDMYYTEEEELKAGVAYPEKESSETEIHIIDCGGSEEESDILEARHIAALITEKIFTGETVFENGKLRPITYKDFCILIRSANKHASAYAKELNLCGVPAWSDTAGKFFGTVEISSMLSLLKVIDNPIQDVPLLSVLISPIFGFSAEKLADIRLEDKKSSIYMALKKLSENGDEECKNFIDTIENYRKIAVTLSSDELIEHIYETTDFPSMVLAMKDPETRLSNLRMLSEYAKTYESYGYRGLCGFIKFIDKLELRKEDLTPAATISEASNVVRIMSIHRSKGLEFPVCILAGCANEFNRRPESVSLHHNLGLGIKIRDKEKMIQYSSVPKYAVCSEIEREYMSEELRVLYVALTRAKEKLIMVTSLEDPEKKLAKLGSNLTNGEHLAPYTVRSAGSFSDLLLMCALRHPDGGLLRNLACVFDDNIIDTKSGWKIEIIKNKEDEVTVENEDIKVLEYDRSLMNKLEKRINYNYPLVAVHNVPTKVSASEIYKEDNLEKMHNGSSFKVPSFILGEEINAAQRGTALHLFLEFADYKQAVLNLENQIDKLVNKGFISKAQAVVLNKRSLENFFESNLLKRIIVAESYIREMRFSVAYDEGVINSDLVNNIDNELVVLQGAIDCVFIENGKAVIVDYKTNSFKDEAEYIKKYSDQLNLYRYAVEKTLNIEVKECIIYSFKMNKEVNIK